MNKITCLGSGNAFTKINFNQSFLISFGKQQLLIDCGRTIPEALAYQNIDVFDINAVYISHAHSDHIGGLEWLAFQRYDWENKPRLHSLRDINSKGLVLYSDELLVKELWENSLKGGLESMEGFVATLATFFNVFPIEANREFEWERGLFKTIQQIHIMSGSMIKHSFGLFMTAPFGKKIYFTTDSQHCSPSQVEVFYEEADIIIQDCECIGIDTTLSKNKSFKFGSNVHANYAQLAGYSSANARKLSKKIKSKMWLSHYQDFVLEGKDFYGNACDWDRLAQEDGFKGFIKPTDIIEI